VPVHFTERALHFGLQAISLCGSIPLAQRFTKVVSLMERRERGGGALCLSSVAKASLHLVNNPFPCLPSPPASYCENQGLILCICWLPPAPCFIPYPNVNQHRLFICHYLSSKLTFSVSKYRRMTRWHREKENELLTLLLMCERFVLVFPFLRDHSVSFHPFPPSSPLSRPFPYQSTKNNRSELWW